MAFSRFSHVDNQLWIFAQFLLIEHGMNLKTAFTIHWSWSPKQLQRWKSFKIAELLTVASNFPYFLHLHSSQLFNCRAARFCVRRQLKSPEDSRFFSSDFTLRASDFLSRCLYAILLSVCARGSDFQKKNFFLCFCAPLLKISSSSSSNVRDTRPHKAIFNAI